MLTNIKTALRVNLISTSLLYDLPMNLRTKFSVANSVTDLQRIYGACKFCANFDGNLNACKLVCKHVANFNLANLIFARRQTMGKFARQICNKFTGVQILCKSRWKFARVQINIQIYGKFNPCKFNICAQANYRQI